MPESIARIGRERRLQTLAKNLFATESTVDLARAERALLRRNPWLADENAFRANRTVVIPPDLDLPTTDRVARPAAEVDGLTLEVTQGLRVIEELARTGFEKARQEARAALEMLGDEEFVRELAKAAPETRELVPDARDALSEKLAQMDEREGEIVDVIGRALQEFDRLGTRATPPT